MLDHNRPDQTRTGETGHHRRGEYRSSEHSEGRRTVRGEQWRQRNTVNTAALHITQAAGWATSEQGWIVVNTAAFRTKHRVVRPAAKKKQKKNPQARKMNTLQNVCQRADC